MPAMPSWLYFAVGILVILLILYLLGIRFHTN
jgi:hypothetical protein